MTTTDKKPWNSVQKSLLPKPSAYSTFSKKSLSETKRLEEENQKMEERLKAFKEYLKSQKDKRIHADKIWSAGESSKGPLSKYAQNVLAKKKPLRKDLPINFVKSDSNSEKSTKRLIPKPPSAIRTLGDDQVKNMWRIPSSIGRYCDTPSQKSYAEKINEIKSSYPTKKSVIIEDNQCKSQQESLLQGKYDENESHQSFQKALMEWRGGEMQEKTQEMSSRLTTSSSSVAVQQGSSQTSTDWIPKSKESLKNIERQVKKLLSDNSGLSYMEKLQLAKLKESPQEEMITEFDNLNTIDSIMDETPPVGWVTDLHEFKMDQVDANIEPMRTEIITIQELDYDDCFIADEILDSEKIIIQEPN